LFPLLHIARVKTDHGAYGFGVGAGFGYRDIYGPIRKKIEAGREEFSKLKTFCCCLVLYGGRTWVDMSPEAIYPAMLGDLGFQFPVNTETGQGNVDAGQWGFFGHGKMLRYDKNQTPIDVQNTTLSAVIAVQEYHVGMREFLANLGRDEEQRPLDVNHVEVRVITCENPFARISIPDGIFCGPFDERYGGVDGTIQRKFAGKEWLRLEQLDGKKSFFA